LVEQLNEGFAGVDALQVLIRELRPFIDDAAGQLPAVAVALLRNDRGNGFQAIGREPPGS